MWRGIERGGIVGLLMAALVAAGCDGGDEASRPSAEQIEQVREHFRQRQGGSSQTPLTASRQRFRDWGVKDTAADALSRIGKQALPDLRSALADSDPMVRAYAARALAYMGPDAEPAVPELTRALRDENMVVRQFAARALGQIGPEAAEAVPALMEVIRAPDARSETSRTADSTSS